MQSECGRDFSIFDFYFELSVCLILLLVWLISFLVFLISFFFARKERDTVRDVQFELVLLASERSE